MTGIQGRLARAGSSAHTFHPDNFPETGELIVQKAHASAFLGTSLDAQLRTRGIDTVFVCGNSTSGCLRATVVDAAGYGFLVGIVEECVFDRTEAAHAMSLFDMDQKYGDVISIDEASAYLEAIRSS
jgi:maleamate amidohydrolase